MPERYFGWKDLYLPVHSTAGLHRQLEGTRCTRRKRDVHGLTEPQNSVAANTETFLTRYLCQVFFTQVVFLTQKYVLYFLVQAEAEFK